MSTIRTIINEHIEWRGQILKLAKSDLSKTYSGLVAAGYSPARIRALLLDEGWSAEDIAAAQGR